MKKNLNPFEPNRITESQELLRQVMSEALGIYMAKEPKNADEWRDQDWWQLYNHMLHETGEIHGSRSLDRKYHNCLDGINMMAMLAAYCLLKMREDNET